MRIAVFLLLAVSFPPPSTGFGPNTLIRPSQLGRPTQLQQAVSTTDVANLAEPSSNGLLNNVQDENHQASVDDDDWITDAYNTHAEWLEEVQYPVQQMMSRRTTTPVNDGWFHDAMIFFPPTLPAHLTTSTTTNRDLHMQQRRRRPHELFTIALQDFRPTPLMPSTKNVNGVFSPIRETRVPQEWFTEALQDYHESSATPTKTIISGQDKQMTTRPHHHFEWFTDALKDFKPNHLQAEQAFPNRENIWCISPNEWFTEAIA